MEAELQEAEDWAAGYNSKIIFNLVYILPKSDNIVYVNWTGNSSTLCIGDEKKIRDLSLAAGPYNIRNMETIHQIYSQEYISIFRILYILLTIVKHLTCIFTEKRIRLRGTW